MTGLPSSNDHVVDSALKPLVGFFRPGVLEVQAVRPGEIIQEREGKGFVAVKAPALTEPVWRNVNRVLASWTGGTYDPVTSPIVSCKLPGLHRYEGWIGKGVAGGVSVSIRVNRGVVYSLDDFKVPAIEAERIRAVTRAGGNILISGGTSSGKTSLFNALLRSVDPSERVLALQDAPELDLLPFHNRAEYEVDRHGHGTPQSVFLDHFMRARPDRMLLGELSFRNASAALFLLSTGHKGFIATLHSDSARDAIHKAFPDRLRMADPPVNGDEAALAAYLRTAIDMVIQVCRRPEGRRVIEIWEPANEPAPRELI